jgi:hypothetical protein
MYTFTRLLGDFWHIVKFQPCSGMCRSIPYSFTPLLIIEALKMYICTPSFRTFVSQI